MNKIIIATLFALLAISAYGTARTVPTWAAGGTCASGATTGITGCTTCQSSGSYYCTTAAAGYFNPSATSSTPTACADNCATCTSASVCATCYGADANYNATVQGTAATTPGNGSCNICASTFIKDSTAATAACIATTGTCASGFYKNAISAATGVSCIAAAGTCMTGYSNNDGAAQSAPLTADCSKCGLGYTDSSTGAAQSSTPTTACSYCLAATYSFTSGSATAVCATHATACVSGWTESSTGAAPGTRNSTTKGCIYCIAAKIQDQPTAPFNCIDPSAACATGFVKNGGNATQTGYACVASSGTVTCLTGWTQDATTKACTTASSGNILMVSVAVILSIFMIVF